MLTLVEVAVYVVVAVTLMVETMVLVVVCVAVKETMLIDGRRDVEMM